MQPTSELTCVRAGAGDRADPPVRIMLQPIASPLPLGLFVFMIGTFVYATLQLGWIAPSQARPLAIVMLAFVAPLQIISAAIAFWARDTGGATALGLFGMSWTATGVVTLSDPSPAVPALGVLLLCLAGVMTALGIASLSGKPVFSAVLSGARPAPGGHPARDGAPALPPRCGAGLAREPPGRPGRRGRARGRRAPAALGFRALRRPGRA
jgi:uncharacterized protein